MQGASAPANGRPTKGVGFMLARASWSRLLAVGAALVAACATAAGAAAGSGTFTDPAGDAAGAPDVTGVAISDSPTGLMRLSVSVDGLVADTPTGFGVFFDTDRNPATGATGGFEYALMAFHDAAGGTYVLVHWNGQQLKVVSAPSLSLSVSGDTYTFSFPKRELGAPASFAFSVLATANDSEGDITATDRAPDAGAWIYELSTPGAPIVRPLIAPPTTAPAKAKAGRPFTVTFLVTRSDTGGLLTGGTMVCEPSVGGRIIGHRESFAAGRAHLAFTIPKSAKGKTLVVYVTIKLGTQSAHRVVTYHVS